MRERRSRLLIVEDDGSVRRQLASSLAGHGEVLQAGDADEALAILRNGDVDLVLLGARTPPAAAGGGAAGLGLIAEIRRLSGGAPVITLHAGGDGEDALRAAGAGACDSFLHSSPIRDLELKVLRALEVKRLEAEVARLRGELARRWDLGSLKGISPAMQAVREAVLKVAESHVAVLLRGERGTGREHVARAIHAGSPRRDRPFVAVDCTALPRQLLEEELFGYDTHRRAGGAAGRASRVESADGGTLYLGEIGALGPAAQTRLLRVLDTGELEHPPDQARTHVNVRLVAATSASLDEEARQGRFRHDLRRRLSILTIDLAPLRDRKEDIPLLADHFLERCCRRNDLNRKHLTQEAIDCLTAHAWKGNVRELEHVIESLALVAEGATIAARDLPRALRDLTPAGALAGVSLPDSGISLEKHLADFERALLIGALRRTGGRKTEAAGLLGLNKDQMKYLCRKHNL